MIIRPTWQTVRYLRIGHVRSFSSVKLDSGITIAFDVHEPSEDKKVYGSDPIIFIHGFLGSKRNNRVISKLLARDLGRTLYAIDLRNHGDSSHNARHDYTALAEDTEDFAVKQGLQKPTLIGHSMGAKTAMAVALRQKLPVSALIPVDNAPVDAALHSSFAKYIKGMRIIEEKGVFKLSEADAILKDYEDSLPIRQFILTNLVREGDAPYKWRVPLRYLGSSLSNMGDFPFTNPDQTRYEGPTLMVRGTKSPYVADEMLPIVGRFFPKFELRDIDSGHWVISEQPEEFRRVVVDWLQPKD